MQHENDEAKVQLRESRNHSPVPLVGFENLGEEGLQIAEG